MPLSKSGNMKGRPFETGKVREASPRWKGGRYVNARGYVMVYQGPHLTARAEHVLVAENALGRKLKQGEVVHHINGIKTDNRNQNLLICDGAYHHWLHGEMSRRYQREHFNAT